MQRMCFFAFLVGTAALAHAADTQPDKSYPIRLLRLPAPGDAYQAEISVSTDQTETITAPGDAPRIRRSSYRAVIAGRVHIDKVAPKAASALSITLTKFVDPQDNRELIPAGKILDIARDESDVHFSRRDMADIADEPRQILQRTFLPFGKSRLTEDDIFGTHVPRKVAETWPVDASAVATDMCNAGLAIDAKDINGKATLAAIENTPSGPALRMTESLNYANAKLSDLPPTLTSYSIDENEQFERLEPIDPALPTAESKMKILTTLHFTEKDGTIHEERTQTQATFNFKDFTHK